VDAGNPVVLPYTASDNKTGIVSAGVQYRGPAGQWQSAWAADGFASAGPASWVTPINTQGGVWTVDAVTVQDGAGNQTSYFRDGRVVVTPEGLTPPPAPSWDFAALDVTINEKLSDHDVPVLESWSRLSGATLHPGDQVALGYGASDLGSGVHSVAGVWSNGPYSITVEKYCGNAASGPATASLPSWIQHGTWQLQRVGVTDELGNGISYERGGTTTIGPENAVGPPVHTYDLSKGDFTIAAGTPKAHAYADTSNVDCPASAGVSMGTSATLITAGRSVTVAGYVTHGGATIPAPIVAVYSYTSLTPRLASLQRGSSTGRYGKSFTLQRNTNYRARFLGTDQANEASPSSSATKAVKVKPVLRATIDKTSMPLGSTARLWASVSPSAAGQRIYLQRYYSGAWHTGTYHLLSSSSTTAFGIRPASRGTYTYRVYRPADAGHVAAYSSVFTLKVT
jgi:hypothetical protein